MPLFIDCLFWVFNNRGKNPKNNTRQSVMEVPAKRKRVEELPGADFGLGGAWRLKKAVGIEDQHLQTVSELQREVAVLRMRCVRMLTTAAHSDVEFHFEDSTEVLHAHRTMLCTVSSGFRCMFRSGMKETSDGRVKVAPGISVASFKGFLEFIYLGKAGKKCAAADGRQLWVLAEMYSVFSLRAWLIEQGINKWNVGAAYEFALVPEGVERIPMLKACEKWISQHGLSTLDEALRTTNAPVIKAMVSCWMSVEQPLDKITWQYVEDAFRFIDRWASFDTARLAEAAEMVRALDMVKIPKKVLNSLAWDSELLSPAVIVDLLDKKVGVSDDLDVIFSNQFEFTTEFFVSKAIRSMSLHKDTVALVDETHCCVWVFGKTTGQWLHTIGARGSGAGRFMCPNGIAIDKAGCIYVSDTELQRVQIFEAGTYTYLRKVEWDFKTPHGISFTESGNLVVVDGDTILVLRDPMEDCVEMVCSFGGTGSGNGSLLHPRGVCAGIDGTIVVADYGNCRVQIFDARGVFQQSFVQVNKPLSTTVLCR
jgi:hypothetical protein